MITEITREWAMPNKNTFEIAPIGAFVARHLKGRVLDPYARNCKLGDITNDLNPNTTAQYHLDAIEFLDMLIKRGETFDTILYDPPYSPRQITECYSGIGKKATMRDTQSAHTAKECRDRFSLLTSDTGKVLSFGWNSTGMGHGWKIVEILLVAHGGAHNDTICCAHSRGQSEDALQTGLFPPLSRGGRLIYY